MEFQPRAPSDTVDLRQMGSFRVFLQVAIEDITAHVCGVCLFFLAAAALLALFEVIPVPFDLIAWVFIVYLVFLGLRGWRLVVFIKTSVPIFALVGPETGRFRQFVEHVVHVPEGEKAYDIRHTFLKNDVSEGEPILVLVRGGKKKRLLVLKRHNHRSSLI
jgi:hypothetical protein